jgi:hemin uptake protein HemP
MQALNPTSAQPHPLNGIGLLPQAGSTSESVKSTDLLKGQKAVDIEHNGSVYRLQTTKLGKLILTK